MIAVLLWLGCAPEVVQTPACATYVACQATRDAASGGLTDVARLGVTRGLVAATKKG
jgi:hypothetical protein